MGNKKLAPANPSTETTAPDVLVKGLFDTIEHELIPRLLLAHRARGGAEAKDAQALPTGDEIAHLAAQALAQDLAGSIESIDVFMRDGRSLESVLLQFVAPAARLLGEYWDTDRNTYTEVTVGIATFQAVVRTLGSRAVANVVPTRGQVLLTTAPGEQHTLGLVMLNEFLVKAGWSVVMEPGLSHDEIVSAVSAGAVEMVGLTVSNARLLPPLAELIATIKKRSLTRDVLIVVGGSIDLRAFAEANGVSVSTDPRAAVARLTAHVADR